MLKKDRPWPLTLLAAVAATSLILSGCGTGASADDADPNNPVALDVTVLAPSEPYVIPWLVAKDQGFFVDRGVQVENIVAGKGGSQTLRTQLAGSIPIGEVGFRSVAEANAQGADVIAVGGGFQSSSGIDFYALADNHRVSDVESIQTWAYTNAGSTIEALSYLIPDVGGFDDSGDERIAAGGPGEGLAMLESGDVDVAALPVSVSDQAQDKFKLVVRSADVVPRFQQSVITTSREYAESNPEVVRAIVEGYQEAAEWISQHQEEAAALYAAYNDLDEDVARKAVADSVEAEAWGPGFNSESVAVAIDALRATGYEDDVDVCSIFVADYLTAGAPRDLVEDC